MATFTKPASDSDFEATVLQSQEPVLVDFWAPWCGPCLSIGPSLEKLAEQFQGKVKIVKVNVDENPEVSARYGVRSIPYLVMFKDGKAADSVIGAQPPQNLQKLIEKFI